MAFYSALRPTRARSTFAVPAATYRNRFAGFRAELKAVQRVEEARKIEDAKRDFALSGDFPTYKTFLENLISTKKTSVDPDDLLRASQLNSDLGELKVQQAQLEYNTLKNQLDNNEISNTSFTDQAVKLLAKLPPGRAYEAMRASIINAKDAIVRQEQADASKTRAAKLDRTWSQFLAGEFDRATLITKYESLLTEETDSSRREGIIEKIVRQKQEMTKDSWDFVKNQARDGNYTPVTYEKALRGLIDEANVNGAKDLATSMESEADNLRNAINSGERFEFLDGKKYGGKGGTVLEGKNSAEIANFENIMLGYEYGTEFNKGDRLEKLNAYDVATNLLEVAKALYGKYGPNVKIKVGGEGAPFNGEFLTSQFLSIAEGIAKQADRGLLFDSRNDKNGFFFRISDAETPPRDAAFINAPDGRPVPIPGGVAEEGMRYVVVLRPDENGNMKYVAVPVGPEETVESVMQDEARMPKILNISGEIRDIPPAPPIPGIVPGGLSPEEGNKPGGEDKFRDQTIGPARQKGFGPTKTTTAEGIDLIAGGFTPPGSTIGAREPVFGQTGGKLIAGLRQKAVASVQDLIRQAQSRFEQAKAAVPPELRGYLGNLPTPSFEGLATGLQAGFQKVGDVFTSALAGLGQQVTGAKQMYAEDQRRRAEEEARRREEEARAAGGDGGGGEQQPVSGGQPATFQTQPGVTGVSGGGLGYTSVTTPEGIRLQAAPLTTSTPSGQGYVPQEQRRGPSLIQKALGWVGGLFGRK